MMTVTYAKSYHEQLRDVAEAYRVAGNRWPASASDIALWGYNNGMLHPHTGSVLKQFARDIARAFREDYIVDQQGRSVRAKHAAPQLVDGKQKMLWDDIRTASPEHMEKALKLRRSQIVGDCSQLKRDQDSYNDNNPHGAKIQLSFNFERDIEELETVEDIGATLTKKKPK